jgi:hypothetical protein
MVREPRREDQTIWTAIAPEAVFPSGRTPPDETEPWLK